MSRKWCRYRPHASVASDPGYFLENLKDWKEHSQKMLMHPCTRCWQRAALDMLCDAFRNLLCWHWIHRELEAMPTMEAQLQRADYTRIRLYSKDEVAWVTLLCIVDIMIDQALAHLERGVPPSPCMRHCYAWDQSHGGSDIWSHLKHFSDSESLVNMLFYRLRIRRSASFTALIA